MSTLALPSCGFVLSKLTCAVKRVNLASTGTPICLNTAETELFAGSTFSVAASASVAVDAIRADSTRDIVLPDMAFLWFQVSGERTRLPPARAGS